MSALAAQHADTRPRRDNTTPSCSVCQRRKVKCNRVYPCAACSKSGRECTYTALTRRNQDRSKNLSHAGNTEGQVGSMFNDGPFENTAEAFESISQPPSLVHTMTAEQSLGAAQLYAPPFRLPTYRPYLSKGKAGFLGLLSSTVSLGSKPHSACLPEFEGTVWPAMSEDFEAAENQHREEAEAHSKQSANLENDAGRHLWTSGLVSLPNVLRSR